MPAGQARSIVSLWTAAPSAPMPSSAPEGLGYRGCWLRAPDGREWLAAEDIVVCGEDAREDAGAVLERAILATAPSGTLPPGLSE